MRVRPLPYEVSALARRLMQAPGPAQPALAARILREVEAAARWFAETGRAHPEFGDGSLIGRLLVTPLPPESFGDVPAYLDALQIAAGALLNHTAGSQISGFAGACRVPWETNIPQEFAMAETKQRVTTVDPVWTRICDEAEEAVRAEPLLGALIHSGLLHHATFERALAYRFSLKLASGEMSEQILREIADEAHARDSEIGIAARADLMAVYERDPACHRFIQPVLFFKGYQAIQAYRIGHWLWRSGRKDLAYFVQMRVSEAFGVDIHPAARVGKGLMIDHAHSIVIGETAVVGDNVSMLHSVTLGGTGKEDGDRHPKIGNGVLIGAGAKVLGNIRIGQCSRIAAGSVVLEDVPPNTTVAGVPARVVGKAGCAQPALTMDQLLFPE